jgi:hypothetical protein
LSFAFWHCAWPDRWRIPDMPREISITMTMNTPAEAFWALRMDRGFDAFCAQLDSQILHLEPDELSTDAEGLVHVEQRCRLQMRENPVPASVRRMVACPDEFSYRMCYSFHRDAFDAEHPFRYTTEFPVLTDRIKVAGRQWLEPISASCCRFRAVIQLS